MVVPYGGLQQLESGETCLGVWPPYRQQADRPVQTRQEADGVDPPPGSGVVSQHPHPFLTHTTFLLVLDSTYYRRIPGLFCISKVTFYLNCKLPAATPLRSLPICPSSSLHKHPVPLPHDRHYSPFLPFNSILFLSLITSTTALSFPSKAEEAPISYYSSST
jgi:hypothetical protein